MDIDLTAVDETHLRAELARREAERARIAAEVRKRHNENIVHHVDALLAVTPEHDRTSCSDTDSRNYGRCTRCTLLYIQKSECVDDDVVLLEIRITHNRGY